MWVVGETYTYPRHRRLLGNVFLFSCHKSCMPTYSGVVRIHCKIFTLSSCSMKNCTPFPPGRTWLETDGGLRSGWTPRPADHYHNMLEWIASSQNVPKHTWVFLRCVVKSLSLEGTTHTHTRYTRSYLLPCAWSTPLPYRAPIDHRRVSKCFAPDCSAFWWGSLRSRRSPRN